MNCDICGDGANTYICGRCGNHIIGEPASCKSFVGTNARTGAEEEADEELCPHCVREITPNKGRPA